MKLYISDAAKKGFQRAFDIAGVHRDYHRSSTYYGIPRGGLSSERNEYIVDCYALAKDWEAVGEYVRSAEEKFRCGNIAVG